LCVAEQSFILDSFIVCSVKHINDLCNAARLQRGSNLSFSKCTVICNIVWFIDLIIGEEEDPGSNEKPEEIFHLIEHFCLGRRRLHLFGRWVRKKINGFTTKKRFR